MPGLIKELKQSARCERGRCVHGGGGGVYLVFFEDIGSPFS